MYCILLSCDFANWLEFRIVWNLCHHTIKLHQECDQRQKHSKSESQWRYLAVVGWKLMQQLFDSVSLPRTVHVRHPVLRQAAKILVYLYGETSVFTLRPKWKNAESNLFNYRAIYSIAVINQKHWISFSHGYKILSVCMNTSKWKHSSCLCSIIFCLDSASALHPGCYLFGLEPRRDPRVLLGGAARVVVRDGVSLEVWYQLRHHLFQLARHRAYGMLLSHTLAVYTDLPVKTRIASGFIPGDFLLIYNTSQSWSSVRYFKKCHRWVLLVLQVIRCKPVFKNYRTK